MNEDDDYYDEHDDDYEEAPTPSPEDVAIGIHQKINDAITFFEIVKFNFPEFKIPNRIYF